MDDLDLENIPLTEEGLSNLKCKVLKKIAKQRNLVVRNIKKVDLIRALIDCNTQPKSEEFKAPISVDKIEVNKESVRTPKLTTPGRRSSFSTGNRNYWLRGSLKNGSPLQSAIPEGDEEFYNHSAILTDVKDLINIPEPNADRRLTFSTENKNRNLRSSSRNGSTAECVNSEKDKQLETLIDVDKKAINSSKIPPDSDRRLTFSSERKNKRLRSTLINSSPLACVIPEETDRQLEVVTDVDKMAINSSNITPSDSDRRLTFSSERKNKRLRRTLINSPPLPCAIPEETDRQLEVVTDPEEISLTEKSIVEERRNSLKSGTVGTDRRSTYLKGDEDVDEAAINTPKISPLDSSRQLIFSTEKKNRRSSKIRNDTPILDVVIPEEVAKVTDRLSPFVTVNDEQIINTPNSVQPKKYSTLSTGRKSMRLKSISRKASPVLDDVVSQQEQMDIQLKSTNSEEICLTEKSIVEEQRNSLKSGTVGTDRRSTYLKGDEELQDSDSVVESVVENPRSSLRTGLVGNDRRSTYSMDDESLKSSSGKTSLVEDSLISKQEEDDMRSTTVIELQDSDCVMDSVIENPRSSLRSGSVGKDRRSTYSMDGKENESSILHQEFVNSFIENEEESFIRVTPFKEDAPSIRFNESGGTRTSVISQENVDLIARVSPSTAVQKKGVRFEVDEVFERGSISRVTPRKTIVKTPHKVKVLQSSNTPCGKNVARNVQQSSAKIPSAKKMPNFSAIHQKRFKKMESLVDMKKRFADKARKMLCSPDVPRCALLNQSATRGTPFKSGLGTTATPSSLKKLPSVKCVPKTPSSAKKVPTTPSVPKFPSTTKINRFGFKQRMTMDIAKQIVNRDIIPASESKKVEQRGILQGVRLNRRFTLHMQARGFQQ